jgi:hypothetical protein
VAKAVAAKAACDTTHCDGAKAQPAAKKATDGCPAAGGECSDSAKAVAKPAAAKSECCADKAKAQPVAKKATDGCPAAGGECPASAKTVAKPAAAKSECCADKAKAKPAAGKAECSSKKEKCTVNG